MTMAKGLYIEQFTQQTKPPLQQRSMGQSMRATVAAGKANLKAGGSVQTIPSGPESYTPFAMPNRGGTPIGIVSSPGGGSVARAMSIGAAQLMEAAIAGAASLPPAVRQAYIDRNTRTFFPQPTPGLIRDLQTDANWTIPTAEAQAQVASARTGMVNAQKQLRMGDATQARAQVMADNASAAAVMAARTGNVAGARSALIQATNARIQAQQAGKSMISTVASGARHAANHGALRTLQSAPTQAGVNGLNRFKTGRSQVTLPASLNNVPSPKVGASIADIYGGMSAYYNQPGWAFNDMYDVANSNPQLGSMSAGDLAQQAMGEAAKTRQVRSDTYATAGAITGAYRAMLANAVGVPLPSASKGLFAALGHLGDSTSTVELIDHTIDQGGRAGPRGDDGPHGMGAFGSADEDVSYQTLIAAGNSVQDALTTVQTNYNDPSYAGPGTGSSTASATPGSSGGGVAGFLTSLSNDASTIMKATNPAKPGVMIPGTSTSISPTTMIGAAVGAGLLYFAYKFATG
jgi:hypothetical protein